MQSRVNDRNSASSVSIISQSDIFLLFISDIISAEEKAWYS